MSEKGWPVADTLGALLQHTSKEMNRQERRPGAPTARSLLGPGFGPYARTLLDWNSTEAYFNGFWFSQDAANQPTPGTFLGVSIGVAEGHVVQIATRHDHDATLQNVLFMRRIHRHSGQAMVATPWELVAPPVPDGGVIFLDAAAPLPEGWEEGTGITAPTGLRAIRRAVL